MEHKNEGQSMKTGRHGTEHASERPREKSLLAYVRTFYALLKESFEGWNRHRDLRLAPRWRFTPSLPSRRCL
jgi:hypothetical protein